MFHLTSVCGGYKYVFGAVDHHSTFGFLIALKYKSEAPEALRDIVRRCRAAGIVIKRFHTDNENVLHSEDFHAATVSPENPQGVLITTGCEYHSRQKTPRLSAFGALSVTLPGPGFLLSSTCSPC